LGALRLRRERSACDPALSPPRRPAMVRADVLAFRAFLPMIRIPRAGAALAAALLALSGGPAAQAARPHAAALPAPAAAGGLRPGEWPQARSDLKADPEIRFGALPNGMRYAIKR